MHRNGLLTLALSLSLAACASDPDSGPDDNGGDGKGDDATCVEGDYVDWLAAYFDQVREEIGYPLTEAGLAAALAAGADRPCSGGDADYLAWFKSYDLVTARLFNAYQTKVVAFSTPGYHNGDADYPMLVASVMPDEAIRRRLTMLEAIQPKTAGVRGYAAWLQRYAPMFELSADAIVTQFPSLHAVEADGTFNAFEETLLSSMERVRPRSNEEGAFIPFMDAYLPQLETAVASNGLSEAELGVLARLAAVAPEAARDRDYLSWFVAYQGKLESAVALSNDISAVEEQVLEQLEAVRPDGGGERAYKGWFGAFGSALAAAVSNPELTANEQAHLDRYLAIKPCSLGEANQTAHAQLVESVVMAGAEIVALVAQAAPTTCGAAP